MKVAFAKSPTVSQMLTWLIYSKRRLCVLLGCSVVSKPFKNITRIANAVPVTLYSRVVIIVEIVVLNCQKC